MQRLTKCDDRETDGHQQTKAGIGLQSSQKIKDF